MFERKVMRQNDTVNILMVDDQPAKLLTYEAILDGLDANLIAAASGREALKHLLRDDIAVVLMDVNMPEINGFELAQIIREHPRHQKISIIFVSADYVTDVDRLKGYDTGAVDYVSVPIVPEVLRAKVGVFVELYRKTRQLEQLNCELERRVAERGKRSETFAALGRRLAAASAAKEAAQIIAEVTDCLVGWDAFVFTLYAGASDTVQPVLAYDIMNGRRAEAPLSSSDTPTLIVRQVLREGAQLILRDRSELDQRPVEAFGDTARPTASLMFVPMYSGETAVGVISAQSYTCQAYVDDDLATFQALADHCSGALERIQTSEALRVRDQRMREMIEASSDMFQNVRPDGSCEYANRAWRETLGYGADELARLNIFDIIHPDSRAHCQAAFQQILSGQVINQIEAIFVTKDGRSIALEGSINCRFVDGQPVVTQGIFHNVTERRQAEIVRAQLAMIVNASHDAIFSVAADSRVISWNAGAERICGYRADEIIGRSVLKLVPRELRTERIEFYEHFTRGEQLTVFTEEVWKHKDGRLIDIGITVSPITSEGRVTGFAGVARDITAQKRAEAALAEARDAALEASRLKSEFLATMSHEIRTPMNGVIGMAELLLDTELDDEQREFAETINDSGQALLAIINDILDYSKIEADKIRLDASPFSPVDLLGGVGNILGVRARDKRIGLSAEISGDVPPYLLGDAGRLRQVLLNLAGNAVKFTEQGSVRIRAELDCTSSDDVSLRFTISDTGIGIPAAAQPKLFQPFSQADGSTTRQYGGTGLGLAISKRLVELMGGAIGCESVEDQGSTFWFTARFGRVAGIDASQPTTWARRQEDRIAF